MRAQTITGGRAPLSVSSDRIARPAERAARLLTLLGTHGEGARRDGKDGVVEVYPAGALRCWGIPVEGYKRPAATQAREAIVEAVSDAVNLRLRSEDRAALSLTDHATDALVAAVVARAFQQGRVLAPTEGERAAAAIEGWLYLPTGSLDDLA
jgi:hypothetical protein